MSKPSCCSPLPVSSRVWIDTVKRGPQCRVPYAPFLTMHGPSHMLGTGSAKRWEGLQSS
jgi:hypothetical protein